MAQVAIMMVWVSPCPECGSVKKWHSRFDALVGLTAHFIESHGGFADKDVVEEAVYQRDWAFRITRNAEAPPSAFGGASET